MVDRSGDWTLFDDGSIPDLIADGLERYDERRGRDSSSGDSTVASSMVSSLASDDATTDELNRVLSSIIQSERERLRLTREYNKALEEQTRALRDGSRESTTESGPRQPSGTAQASGGASESNRERIRESNESKTPNITVERREADRAQSSFQSAMRNAGFGQYARTEGQIYDTVSTWMDRIATVRDVAQYARTGEIPSRLAEIGAVVTAPRPNDATADEGRGRTVPVSSPSSSSTMTNGTAGAPAGEPVDAFQNGMDSAFSNDRARAATHTVSESSPVSSPSPSSSSTMTNGTAGAPAGEPVDAFQNGMDSAFSNDRARAATHTVSESSPVSSPSPSSSSTMTNGTAWTQPTFEGMEDEETQPTAGTNGNPNNARQNESDVLSGLSRLVGGMVGGGDAAAGGNALGTIIKGISDIKGGASIAGTLGGVASGLLGGPAGIISAIVSLVPAILGGVTQTTQLGSLQGGGFLEGLAMTGGNFWQDFKHFWGATTADSDDLQRYRRTASSMGLDIESSEGKAVISNQEWAQNNGLDAQSAATITRALMDMGASADEAKQSLKDMKSATNDLNMDFNQFGGTVSSISEAARNWGGNVEDATDATKSLYEEMGEAGYDKTEQNADAILSSPLATLTAMQSGASIWEAASPEGIESFLSDNPDAADTMMQRMNGFIGRMASGVPEDQQDAFSAYARQQLLGGVTGDGSKITQYGLDNSGSLDIRVSVDDGAAASISRNGSMQAELSSATGNSFINLNNLGRSSSQ